MNVFVKHDIVQHRWCPGPAMGRHLGHLDLNYLRKGQLS